MGSMQRRMIVAGGALLAATACANGESPESGTAGAGAARNVATSPPLPGFSADVPAGVIPGTAGAGTSNAGTASSGASPSGRAAPSPSPSRATAAAGTTAGSSTPGATLAAGDISAATGVFTAAQAERGREVYTNSCARCHMASQHSGPTFASTWNNRRVSDLYELLYSTMPLDAPGSLTEQQYADVVAYMLQLNGHPAGTSALPANPAALRKVRIDIRSTAGLQ